MSVQVGQTLTRENTRVWEGWTANISCDISVCVCDTLRISLEMYAIQSSFSEFPLVFFTRSVIEPAPQNSITSCKRNTQLYCMDTHKHAHVHIVSLIPTRTTQNMELKTIQQQTVWNKASFHFDAASNKAQTAGWLQTLSKQHTHLQYSTGECVCVCVCVGQVISVRQRAIMPCDIYCHLR